MSETQRLRSSEINVLRALVYLAGDRGRVTVAQHRLMAALGWTRRNTLARTLWALEGRGLVTVERGVGGTRPGRSVNTYAITPMGMLIAGMHGTPEEVEAA